MVTKDPTSLTRVPKMKEEVTCNHFNCIWIHIAASRGNWGAILKSTLQGTYFDLYGNCDPYLEGHIKQLKPLKSKIPL